jgi:putative ABC transport system substrate-binding protein
MQRQRLTGYPTSLGELVRLEVDVIVVGGGASAIRSAKDATNTIPIVMTGTADPVASGLIVSLARPGGNVTGPTFGGYELAGKRLELLKEIVPKVSPVAVLLSATSPTVALSLNEMQNSARALGLQIQALEVQSASDFERAFQAAIKARVRILSVDPSRYLPLTENTSCSLRQKPIARNLSFGRSTWKMAV